MISQNTSLLHLWNILWKLPCCFCSNPGVPALSLSLTLFLFLLQGWIILMSGAGVPLHSENKQTLPSLFPALMFTEELFAAQIQVTHHCCYMKACPYCADIKIIKSNRRIARVRAEAILWNTFKSSWINPETIGSLSGNKADFFFLVLFLTTWHLRATISLPDMDVM